jgi:hypothetical protein
MIPSLAEPDRDRSSSLNLGFAARHARAGVTKTACDAFGSGCDMNGAL